MRIQLFMKSEKADFNAKAIYEDGIITILKGSKIKKENPKFNRMEILNDIRNNVELIDKDYILKKDIKLNSPSTAAQLVADSSRNGLLYWRDKNNKKLKTILSEGENNG